MLPWLVARVIRFPLVATLGSCFLMFTLLPKEQAHVTIVIATKVSPRHRVWFIYRYGFMQCFELGEELAYWSCVIFVWQTSPRGCYAGCYAVFARTCRNVVRRRQPPSHSAHRHETTGQQESIQAVKTHTLSITISSLFFFLPFVSACHFSSTELCVFVCVRVCYRTPLGPSLSSLHCDSI